MTSFTEHLCWVLAGRMKAKSVCLPMNPEESCAIHDDASTLRTRVVHSLKYSCSTEASPQSSEIPGDNKRSHFREVSLFYCFVNACARLQKIYRLNMIIYPAPIVQCYLYRHPLTVCTVYTVFIPMYLLHFRDMWIILVRQTTNISNSKQDFI